MGREVGGNGCDKWPTFFLSRDASKEKPKTVLKRKTHQEKERKRRAMKGGGF
jgi:hypothetical protein